MTLLTDHKAVKKTYWDSKQDQKKYKKSKTDLRTITNEVLAKNAELITNQEAATYAQELSTGISSVLRAYGTKINAGEVYAMFQIDALLKCLYENRKMRYKHISCVSHLDKVDCGRYPYQVLLDTRNELWPTNANLFDIDAATVFAKHFATNELLPVFIFTQLADPESTEYLLDLKGNGSEFTLGWLLGRLKKKAVFRAEAKERSFQESARYLQLFMACLRNDDAMEPACKYLLTVKEDKPEIPYYMCKTMPRSAAKKVMYGELEESDKGRSKVDRYDLVLDAALNLYVFNQETSLLDWMWATEHTTMDVLELTDMFTIKTLPLPYDDMDDDLKEAFIEAAQCIFQKIYQVISSEGDETLEGWYGDLSDVLDRFTVDVIDQAEEFNFYVGNLCLMDGTEGKAAPITHLYKEMVRRTGTKKE